MCDPVILDAMVNAGADEARVRRAVDAAVAQARQVLNERGRRQG